jgi:hypothetical protein
MRVQHIGYRIRGFYRVAANDASRFFVSSISTAWRRPPTPSTSRAARSTAGRLLLRPMAATRPPWRQNPLPPGGEEPPRPTPAW